MKKSILALTGLFLIASSAHASLNDDVNSLGGNKDLIRRARAIDPKNRVQVVQNRSVDRTNRLEVGVNYGLVNGGDPYVRTTHLGANLDFHFNPHWSIGARYINSDNRLSSEGERVFKDANAARASGTYYERPDVDYAGDTYLGVINWYPIYGKLNMFDMGISQFDIYLLAGGGQVKLNSGSAPTYTAGAGLGFWLSQHFTMRFEGRYQTYEDQIYTGSRKLDLTIFTATLGIML